MLKTINCDQCGRKFKHGRKMDLRISRIHIRDGTIDYDINEDIEFFADFCSDTCMAKYMWQQYFEIKPNEVGVSPNGS